MKALRRLEQGGFRFNLNGGKLTYAYHGDLPLPEQWARSLLEEVRANRVAVESILRARQEWIEAFDEWSNFQTEVPARDASYLSRLAELAIAGQLPCYEDGETDAGPPGWRRLAKTSDVVESTKKEAIDMGIRIEQTSYEAVPTGDYRAKIVEIVEQEGSSGCSCNSGARSQPASTRARPSSPGATRSSGRSRACMSGQKLH